MNILMSEVELRRKQALLTLIEESEKWNKEQYELRDYCLDKCLRELLGLPEKHLGKAPCQWTREY